MAKITIAGLILIVAVAGSNSCGLNIECGEQVDKEVRSPGGEYVAFSIQRDCGATTDISSIVKVGQTSIAANADEDLVFIVSGRRDIKLRWVDSQALEIDCDDCDEDDIFKKEGVWKDRISVHYAFGQN